VVEALYSFPVPRGASVSDFTMWIGGKPMVGEVVEKKRAREIYESYRQYAATPALLEQVDYRRFEMRIFPIAAGAEQRVRPRVPAGAGLRPRRRHLRPIRSPPRRAAAPPRRPDASASAWTEERGADRRADQHFAQDRLATARHDSHYVQASLEAAAADLSRDVVVAYRTQRPHTGLDLVASRAGSEDG
jgi:Ca-activated chloride channel family protein